MPSPASPCPGLIFIHPAAFFPSFFFFLLEGQNRPPFCPRRARTSERIHSFGDPDLGSEPTKAPRRGAGRTHPFPFPGTLPDLPSAQAGGHRCPLPRAGGLGGHVGLASRWGERPRAPHLERPSCSISPARLQATSGPLRLGWVAGAAPRPMRVSRAAAGAAGSGRGCPARVSAADPACGEGFPGSRPRLAGCRASGSPHPGVRVALHRTALQAAPSPFPHRGQRRSLRLGMLFWGPAASPSPRPGAAPGIRLAERGHTPSPGMTRPIAPASGQWAGGAGLVPRDRRGRVARFNGPMQDLTRLPPFWIAPSRGCSGRVGPVAPLLGPS